MTVRGGAVEQTTVWTLGRLRQNCERFGRAFGGCFSQVLEHEIANVDYAALCGRSGVGVARGLTAETVVALCKATRLTLRRESRRMAALRRLGASGCAPACEPPHPALRWHFRKEESDHSEPQPER